MLPFETVDTAIAMVDIFRLNRVTEDYLCPPEANVYGIDFTRSKMIFITLITIVTFNTIINDHRYKQSFLNFFKIDIAIPLLLIIIIKTNLTRFKIRDITSSTTLFEIAKPANTGEDEDNEEDGEEVDPNAGRFVRYQFTPQVGRCFLKLYSSKCIFYGRGYWLL